MSDLFWLTDDQMARFFSAIRFRVTHTALAHDPTPATAANRRATHTFKDLIMTPPRSPKEHDFTYVISEVRPTGRRAGL